jgi:ABC-type transport system involved in multi-copper enzyme maturation permease subunit
MTFLPIIERELRVRARNRAAYWTRFAVALASMLVCLPQLMWSGPFGTPTTMGESLFNGIVSAAFLLSCGACLLTADVISSERREGTLGLLLLTRVTTFDVLLGKLGSAGLTSLCALVACLPMLMIPLLAGGVTGGEVFRKGLVLVATLFLAMAAGVWASARGHEWLKTARTALLLVATLVLVPSLVGVLFKPVGAAIGLLSPLGTISAAGDALYKVSAADYWVSLLLVQAVGWALLVGADFRLRSSWREERGEIAAPAPTTAERHLDGSTIEGDRAGVRPSSGAAAPESPSMQETSETTVLACLAAPEDGRTPTAGTGCTWPEGREAEPAQPSRRPLGDANPIVWLLQRQRGIPALLWAGALVSLTSYGLFTIGLRFLSPSSYSSLSWPLSLSTTALEGALFAWAASRFFVEARRTGELELLLATPLGASEIVSAQWDVLKRLLRWPMLVLLAPTLLQSAFIIVTMPTSRSFGPGGSFGLHYAISCVVRLVDTFFGVGALCWLGLWFGFRAGGQGRAIAWTISLAGGLPFLISLLCSILLPMLTRSAGAGRSSSYWIIMWLPQAITLVLYLGLIRLARQRLAGELAGAEAMRFDLRQFISSAARDTLSGFNKARHWTPS